VPGKGKASLTYRVRISHPRGDGRFDARMTPDWALLRGDDLVPAATLDMVDGTELVSRLEFELPKGWKSVETGWTRVGKNRFRIDNPERLFDRPTGWIIAGKLGSRRATLGNTDITVSAPVGEQMRRMDILTLMTYIWPYAREVFPREPGKLLIVGANDPMWRGGLSGPNSLFMHSARPLVSENGTSSLVHELVHVLSRIDDTDRSDWITEGVAEYYAIELLRRSGGLGDDRYESVRKHLRQWSRKVDSLRGEHATGPVTARAVLLMQDLDKEIRLRTDGKHSMDDVTRALMRLDKASTRDFIEISENLMGGASDVLDSKLLR
jgi:predicted metalloprotease with PDZ domain